MTKGSYDPTADEGVYAVGLIFARHFRWAFREQPKADFGIDAQVEVCRDGQPTGNLLALQIKAGESYLRERVEKGFVYRDSPQHLQYWLNHPLPVMLVVYSPSEQEAYWQGVSQESTDATDKGCRIVVPFEHRLNSAALPHILGFMEAGTLESVATVDEQTLDTARTALRTLGAQEIGNLRDQFTLRMSERVDQLAQRLWRNGITCQDWRDEMRMQIKTAFICQYLLAKGGLHLMTQTDYARIGAMVGQQYRSLEVFISDMAQGRYRPSDIDAVVERSKLHVICSELAFEMARMSRGGADPTYIETSGSWTVGA